MLCIGSMFGVGGSALISYINGERVEEGANRFLTRTDVSLIQLTSVTAVFFCIFMPALSKPVGANSETQPMCVLF